MKNFLPFLASLLLPLVTWAGSPDYVQLTVSQCGTSIVQTAATNTGVKLSGEVKSVILELTGAGATTTAVSLITIPTSSAFPVRVIYTNATFAGSAQLYPVVQASVNGSAVTWYEKPMLFRENLYLMCTGGNVTGAIVKATIYFQNQP